MSFTFVAKSVSAEQHVLKRLLRSLPPTLPPSTHITIHRTDLQIIVTSMSYHQLSLHQTAPSKTPSEGFSYRETRFRPSSIACSSQFLSRRSINSTTLITTNSPPAVLGSRSRCFPGWRSRRTAAHSGGGTIFQTSS